MGKGKQRKIEEMPENEKVPQKGPMDNERAIKSNATVKFSTALVSAPFTLLQNNTNLNLPPPNWLSNSVSMYGVPSQILQRSGFSSFSMANQFPDCIGAVDVISDAENVKRLLKMAYSSGPTSFLIHRVENTLLIDDFDLKKVLLASDGHWGWLRKFFEPAIKMLNVKPEKGIEYGDKKRTALQSKNLISKFFYHSLNAVSEEDCPKPADPKVAIPLPFLESEPPLPEPNLAEELPDPDCSHTFSRNVVWTFEDIQMLLGTDIPIFGGDTHPCISLKLRDMNKPINVLTGMDYWLDNLMCNVPEVMMCYHLNGIVQRYELIKTEDLPNLPNSKFSPKMIRDIAQNILSFLKSNATKSGHTYWLFKGKDDEVVKLYDLTSLCGDILEGGQTPFTVPVAMLLYRVARNLRHQDGRRQAATVSKLLRNCVELLPEDKYPEIATSAHYMLSDVYLPSETDPSDPNLEESCEQSSEDVDEEDEYFPVTSTSLSAIMKPLDSKPATSSTSTPISNDVSVRCLDSLKHILEGMRICIDIQQTEPEMASKSEAIPMPCGSPEKSPNAITKKKSVPGNGQSWTDHLRRLLFEKAVLTFTTLLEECLKKKEHGKALRYASMGMRVEAALKRRGRTSTRWCGTLYGKSAEALYWVTRLKKDEMGTQDSVYREPSPQECDVLKMLRREGEATDLPAPLPPTLDSVDLLLLASAACYNRAVEVESDKLRRITYTRQLGGVENELGVCLMNQACSIQQESDSASKVTSLLSASQAHLDASIAAFENVADPSNLALVNSNVGRLQRIRAHYYLPSQSDRGAMAAQEKIFYNRAIDSYLKAIKILGERSVNANVWDSVFWELSTTYSMMAKLLQDYPACEKSQEEAERELTDVLHKALKYIDLETASDKLPVYRLRASKIHHRLAMLHHTQFRHASCEVRKKHTLQLAKLHYEKAAALLNSIKNTTCLIQVQLERVALAELLAEGGTVASKPKHLLSALELIVELTPVFKRIGKEEKAAEEEEETDRQRLFKFLLQRIQQLLLFFVKEASKKPQAKKSVSSEDCKKLYSNALRCCNFNEVTSSPPQARKIANLLGDLTDFLKASQQR